MPRPRSLSNVTSARPNVIDDQLLTPRTPHSRSGRAEEGYTEFELQQLSEIDDDQWGEQAQQQAVPLLSSSASDSFPVNQTTGYRSRGDDYDSSAHKRRAAKDKPQMATVLHNTPLALGSLLAALLLFLTYVSYYRPEKLHNYLGISPLNSTAPPLNSTSLPLNSTTTPLNSTTTPLNSTNVIPQNTTENAIDPHLLISYENYTTFPLQPTEYLKECAKMKMSHGEYWQPPKMGVMDTLHPQTEGSGQVCASTITYMLDGRVGLLADLALLAQVAGLAREVKVFSGWHDPVINTYQRNRTLLVDDTYWNRGKHWIINSRTAKYHLGHAYSEAYEDPYARNLNRLKPMFKSSKDSLEVILPNQENARLVQLARTELLASMSPDDALFNTYIALHLRRGDRGPVFYRGGQVPAKNFVEAATKSWNRLNPDQSLEDLTLFVASDSASAFREVLELTSTRFTTFSLFDTANAELQPLASPKEYVQKEFDLLDAAARIQATRGMIVDFALVSGMWAGENDPTPLATVCTFSSNVCKLAAVGLGWEAAFGTVESSGAIDDEHKGWVEIDQNGAIVPIWWPFELF
ncbi:hypothetical protein H0H92_015942 [Tricholoma furcatifolium]|nr:hypothetical protein H0H92_015942 [Tricholoma furcatifolium]